MNVDILLDKPKIEEIIGPNFKVLKEKRRIISVNISERLLLLCDKIQNLNDENYTLQNLSRSDILNLALNELFLKYNV
jgi:hypothetical protein